NLPQFFDVFVFRLVADRIVQQRKIPVFLGQQIAVFIEKKITGGNFANRFEDRVRGGHVLIGKILAQGARVYFSSDLGMFQQRLDLRAKNNATVVAAVVQRFFADSVARQKKGFVAGVPEREGKHSLETFQTLNAFFFIEVDNNLGVRVGPEAVALFFEFRSQLAKIIDLAVIS